MTDIAAPVSAKDRYESLDVLRGIAVLGILMVNVQAFTMAPFAYMNPTAHMDITGANLDAWLMTHVFFEMKFITLFSALFGAGIILMVGEEPGASRKVHFSRMRWLLLIGLVHMFALWFGDILVTYAIAGMIVIYFRQMSVGKLLFWGGFWITLSGVLFIALMWSLSFVPENMSAAEVGMGYTEDQLTEIVAAYQNGYLSSRAPNAINGAMNLLSLVFFGGRIIGVMFLGMALYKSGFLLARWGFGSYLITLAIGLGAGLTLSGYGGLQAIESGFDFRQMWVHVATNYVGSLLVALGYASVVMILCKIAALKLIRAPFAAAGRMAFTNYLTQTITMVFITVGGVGLGMFGELERVQQVQIVLAIWVVQLIISPIWLSVFRFGPFEWLWRSLTYGKLQPFMKGSAS
ncbi:MAG: DUF418 domain-containing protein [Pseudomonadota bacterium]